MALSQSALSLMTLDQMTLCLNWQVLEWLEIDYRPRFMKIRAVLDALEAKKLLMLIKINPTFDCFRSDRFGNLASVVEALILPPVVRKQCSIEQLWAVLLRMNKLRSSLTQRIASQADKLN